MRRNHSCALRLSGFSFGLFYGCRLCGFAARGCGAAEGGAVVRGGGGEEGVGEVVLGLGRGRLGADVGAGLGGGLDVAGLGEDGECLEAEDFACLGVGLGAECGVEVVVFPVGDGFAEAVGGGLELGDVLGVGDAHALGEVAFEAEGVALLEGGVDALEVFGCGAALVGGVGGLLGHDEECGVVGAEEVVLHDGAGLVALCAAVHEVAREDGGVVGAHAAVHDLARDGALDAFGVGAEGAGGFAADGGGDVGGDPAVLVHDDGVEVVGGVLGDLEGLPAEGSCEEAFGLCGGAVDAGVSEELQVVLDGALFVEDVVDGVEEAGGLGRPTFALFDDVGGDGLQAVAAGEAEAVAAGGDLHGAVVPLDDDDGFGGDALVFALEFASGHLTGDGVGVALELGDAEVDAEGVEGDVMDPDVGAVEELVEVEDGTG